MRKSLRMIMIGLAVWAVSMSWALAIPDSPFRILLMVIAAAGGGLVGWYIAEMQKGN